MTTARNWDERYANESFEDDSDIETIQKCYAYNNPATSYSKLKKNSQPIKGNSNVKKSTPLLRSASSIKKYDRKSMRHYNTSNDETENDDNDVIQHKMIDIDTKSMNFEDDIHSSSTSYRPDIERKNLDEQHLLHRNENIDNHTETEDDEEDYKLIKQMEKKYKQNIQMKNIKSTESSTDDADDDGDGDDAVDDDDEEDDAVDDDDEADAVYVDDEDDAVDDDDEDGTVDDDDEDVTDDGDINDHYVDNDDGDEVAFMTDEDHTDDDNQIDRNDGNAEDNEVVGDNGDNDDVDDAVYTGKRDLGGGDGGCDEYDDYDYFDDNSDDENDANTEEDQINITSRLRENIPEDSKQEADQYATEAKQQNPDDNIEKSNNNLESSKQYEENCPASNSTLDAKIKSSVESMVEILHKSLQDVKLNENDIILSNEILQPTLFDNPKNIAMAMISAVKSTVFSNQSSNSNLANTAVAFNKESNQDETSKETIPKGEDETSSKTLSKISDLEICKENAEIQHETHTNSNRESARNQPEFSDTEYGYHSTGMRYSNKYATDIDNYYDCFFQGTPEKKMPLSPSLDKLKAKAHPRKSWSFSNERMREIERHNKILLRKILTQKPTYACPQTQSKQQQMSKLSQITLGRVPSAAVNRKKQQRQIDLDNQVLKRKIEAISLRRPALPSI